MLHHAAGDYIDLSGWREDIGECRTESDLPAAAREYLGFISEYVGVPIALIGVGPGRDDVIWTGSGEATAAARLARATA